MTPNWAVARKRNRLEIVILNGAPYHDILLTDNERSEESVPTSPDKDGFFASLRMTIAVACCSCNSLENDKTCVD